MNATFQQRQIQRQVATPAMMLEMSLLGLPADALSEAVKKERDVLRARYGAKVTMPEPKSADKAPAAKPAK